MPLQVVIFVAVVKGMAARFRVARMVVMGDIVGGGEGLETSVRGLEESTGFGCWRGLPRDPCAGLGGIYHLSQTRTHS